MNEGARRTNDRPRLGFRIGDRRFALPLASVRRVAVPDGYARLPLQPAWLCGLANVGGEVVAALDLAAWLGRLASPVAPRLLVVGTAEARVALLVDEVLGLAGEAESGAGETAAAAPEPAWAVGEDGRAVHEPPLLDLDGLIEAVEVEVAALAPKRGTWLGRAVDAPSGG